MVINKIENDPKFIKKRLELGIRDYKGIELYDEVIALETLGIELYVFFDKKYNVIGVFSKETCEFFYPLDDYVNEYYDIYKNYTLDKTYKILDKGKVLNNPLKNYTIEQIMELANRIKLISFDNINNNYKKMKEEDNTYKLLLSYIKFIAAEIKEIYKNMYQTQIVYYVGYEYRNVYRFLFTILDRIDDVIYKCLKNGEIPTADDILNRLGQSDSPIMNKYKLELEDSIKLMINYNMLNLSTANEVAYHFDNTPNKDAQVELDNIVNKADNLLSLLDVPDKEKESYKKKVKLLVCLGKK